MINKINKKIIIPSRDNRNQILASLSRNKGKIATDDLEAAITVFELAEKIQNALNLHFTRYGLTQARFIVLLTMFAGKNKNYSPHDLAEKIGVKPPTMTGILDGLARQGYIERITDTGDRRRVNISLTSKGKKIITVAMPDHFKKVTASFSNLQKRDKLDLLKKITSEIEQSLFRLTEGIISE